MIGAVREWIASLVAVSLFLSLAQSLVPEGTLRKIASFTGGLILLAALLQPLTGAERWETDFDLAPYEEAIGQQRLKWEAAGNAQLAAEISHRTEEAIKAKAAALGLAVEVRVDTKPDVHGTPVPSAAELDGAFDETLSNWMVSELAIPPEAQVWGGNG